MHRLGAVSFLNSKPLIAGLTNRDDVHLRLDVPSRLGPLLDDGRVDAALIPIVDLFRSDGRWRPISDACIGSDGETMTVRIFSQSPPDRIEHLHADTDSHTSVALATVLWRELYGRTLAIEPLQARSADLARLDSVLLIGDKVVDPLRAGFAFEVDLGGAWRQLTGLPFVFAVWAEQVCELPLQLHANLDHARHRISGTSHVATTQDLRRLRVPRRQRRSNPELAALLSQSRQLGLANLRQIARREGPLLGWTVELATRYLTRCLTFTLDDRHVAGADRFARLCAQHNLAPPSAHFALPAPQAAHATP